MRPRPAQHFGDLRFHLNQPALLHRRLDEAREQRVRVEGF
jgi:hypothetical protein